MQKKLIALAVAGLASSGAFAQMNVTVFGTLDTSVIYTTGTSKGLQGGFATGAETGVGITGISTATEVARGGQTSMISGSNRATSVLGFKGTEDLGGGLKLNFTVISTLDTSGATGQAAPAASLTSGNGLFGNRETAIDLVGSFGTFRFGRMSFIANDTYGDFEASGDKSSSGSMNALNFNPLSSRVNNSILYATPNMGGFVASYQVAMSENQDKVAAGTSGTLTGLMVRYNAGPVAALLSQTIARDYAVGAVPNTVFANTVAPAAVAANGLGKSITINRLGASYDFGVAKLLGAYMTTVNTKSGAEVARTIDANTWSLSGLVPMGAHLFRVEYVSTNDKRTNDADANSWMLGYDYALSKRTSAYLGAVKVNNKNGATFSAGSDTTASMTGVTRGSQAAATLATVPQAGRTNAYFAGLLHTF